MAKLFHNTNDKKERVTFQEALLRGPAPNDGLYTPDPTMIPQIPMEKIKGASKPYWYIAAEILKPYLADEIPTKDLLPLLKDAYDETVIPIPIQRVVGETHIMWLTKGPTCSFKDFAARFFARTLNYFAGKLRIKLIVVVATSGDTGPAIASALHGLENIAIIVLYPGKNISAGQRKQMTTLGGNVYAVEVANGDFNLCQDLAIKLMSDKQFAHQAFGNENIFTSANSISLGRLLPQIVFPFYAYSQLAKTGEKIIVSIPSGNFGDMVGSVIAKKMGLPIEKIIVAVNENDEFYRFLYGEGYKINKTQNTYSSAMDVNNPNNLPRLFDLYGGHMINCPDEKGIIDAMPNMNAMMRNLFSTSVTNAETIETIQKIYYQYEIIMDPHGAVGMTALNKYFNSVHNQTAIVWETAEPCKFPETVKKAIGIIPPLAATMAKQVNLPERKFVIESKAGQNEKGIAIYSAVQYEELKKIIVDQVRL